MAKDFNYKIGDHVYLLSMRFGIIELTLQSSGLWMDCDGTAYALRDIKGSDPVDRAGIYPFIMPIETPIEGGSKIHDWMAESSGYQMFHTWEEANKEFKRLNNINTKGHWSRILVNLFSGIVSFAKPFISWGKRV